MLLAQNPANQIFFPGNTTPVEGPPGLRADITNLGSLVSVILPYLFLIAGILLFGYLIMGGFTYLTAMGDPKKAESAKGKITNALIGFFLIFAAYWIVQIVDRIFMLGIYSAVPTPTPLPPSS
jgi:hypothetical protein